MIVPAPRLLWIAAAIVLPAASIAGLVPSLAFACWIVAAACALVAAVDALYGVQRLDCVGVQVPALLRLTKNVPATVPVTIEGGPVRIALPMPHGMESEHTVLNASAGGAEETRLKSRVRIDWQVIGRERGDHALRAAHIEKPSPLGLWVVRGKREISAALRVYPNLRDRATAMLFLKAENTGLRTRRQVGRGREFDNLRHYLPGDLFEDIHWKATARRTFPVVKLYRVEQAQEVYAVIDSSRLSAREGVLDSYVDAALHLALAAERMGDRFGLATFSDHTQDFVRAANGLDHFRRCRETIYNLRARRVSPDFRGVFTSLQTSLRRRVLLVFFTSLDDALLAETFEQEIRVLARRHLVRVNVPEVAGVRQLFTGGEAEDLESAYEGLAGQMLWNRRRTLEIALRNRGVRLAVVNLQRIKEQVASQYLEVKRRQAL